MKDDWGGGLEGALCFGGGRRITSYKPSIHMAVPISIY